MKSRFVFAGETAEVGLVPRNCGGQGALSATA
jgi:hypothetical protein